MDVACILRYISMVYRLLQCPSVFGIQWLVTGVGYVYRPMMFCTIVLQAYTDSTTSLYWACIALHYSVFSGFIGHVASTPTCIYPSMFCLSFGWTHFYFWRSGAAGAAAYTRGVVGGGGGRREREREREREGKEERERGGKKKMGEKKMSENGGPRSNRQRPVGGSYRKHIRRYSKHCNRHYKSGIQSTVAL